MRYPRSGALLTHQAGKLLLETVPELECVGKPFSEELECL